MKPIFEYMDYRDYLRDYYTEKKKEYSFYSYRLFSQKAGLKSPNFLKLVITGQRNISKDSTFKFSRALGHTKKEADYFENLVFFNQSKTLDEKNVYLSKLMKYRKKTDPYKIEESEYAYYSQWYNPTIRELVTATDFNDDFKKLGASVVPAIPAAEAEKSVQLLEKLDFIRKEKGGSYVKTTAILTTGPQVRSLAVANYHKAMMQLASESIERFTPSDRDITSITVNVSEETFQLIVAKLQDYRQELLKIAQADKDPQKVLQLNFQLFPLSTKFKQGDSRQ